MSLSRICRELYIPSTPPHRLHASAIKACFSNARVYRTSSAAGSGKSLPDRIEHCDISWCSTVPCQSELKAVLPLAGCLGRTGLTLSAPSWYLGLCTTLSRVLAVSLDVWNSEATEPISHLVPDLTVASGTERAGKWAGSSLVHGRRYSSQAPGTTYSDSIVGRKIWRECTSR